MDVVGMVCHQGLLLYKGCVKNPNPYVEILRSQGSQDDVS